MMQCNLMLELKIFRLFFGCFASEDDSRFFFKYIKRKKKGLQLLQLSRRSRNHIASLIFSSNGNCTNNLNKVVSTASRSRDSQWATSSRPPLSSSPSPHSSDMASTASTPSDTHGLTTSQLSELQGAVQALDACLLHCVDDLRNNRWVHPNSKQVADCLVRKLGIFSLLTLSYNKNGTESIVYFF